MQRTNRWMAAGWAILGATLAVGTGTVISTAQAQFGQGGQGGGQPGQPGQPGGPGGGLGGGAGRFGGFGGGGGGTAIAASGSNVFVVRGNTLYMFIVSGTSMTYASQAQLPAPPPGQGFGGQGFGGQGGAGGQGGRRRGGQGGAGGAGNDGGAGGAGQGL